MTFRSRIAFSVFIGPFLILGSIIVSSSKNGLNLSFNSTKAWIAALIAAAAFWALGLISGRIERGSWDQCNQWRQCIIKLQNDNALTEDDLEKMVLDKPYISIVWVYALSFILILITFATTAYLATELVRGGVTPTQ